MIYQVKSYLKFLLQSTNQHGVHSPFVFDLVTKCFYDRSYYPAYEDIMGFRAKLLRTDKFIDIEDLGPGSKKTKQKQRHVSEIAKTSGTPIKRAKVLYRLSKYFQPNTVLELGTSLGTATHAIAKGNPEAQITTIEGCPNLHSFSKYFLEKHASNTINFINADFSDAISALTPTTYDLVFFDGNHQKEATLSYFESLLPMATNESVFIFDDIYWSKGMTEAWELIKQHPKTRVTIDTFYWGFVFFRQEQAKEHFKIRL